ncbi:Uncharacterised protein [Mannheimia haemolytica]|nr:Uncharacterised protein [Mannheimia haemolytica]
MSGRFYQKIDQKTTTCREAKFISHEKHIRLNGYPHG